MYPIRTKQPYDPDNLTALAGIYTTPYLGNYVAGNYDEWSGSHPGVDIVPVVTASDVFSVLNGVVEVAWEKWGDGKYVVIRHDNAIDPDDFSRTTTLYSSYLHLSAFSVKKGDKVEEGDIIGQTGNTGNSTGEHLHFQLDRANAPFRPYWPFTTDEARAAGLGFFEAVNRGLGIEKARLYTVNPLVYLDALENAPSLPPVADKTTTHTTTPEKTVIASSSISLGEFSDVPSSNPYHEAIMFLRKAGIATGKDGMFRPNSTVSRGEILKMAFLASGKPLSHDIASHFSDVPVGNGFLQYVNTARETHAVNGYSDGTFRPNNPVTRAEGLKILLNILLSEAVGSLSVQIWKDVAPDAWYAGYANWANVNDIFKPSSNMFLPDTYLTRGEVASIIFAAKNA